jgi:hypothetical protein
MRTSVPVITLTLLVLSVVPAHAGFEQVPEPGSLALLGTGIAAIAGISWWLRRK